MRANSPFSLHRHFIRLLWICFPVERKTFSKYSYLPLLVIITIITIYIINKRFSQKNVLFKPSDSHVTLSFWKPSCETCMQWHIHGLLREHRFLRCKNCSDVGFWSEAPEKILHIYLQKVFEKAKISSLK